MLEMRFPPNIQKHCPPNWEGKCTQCRSTVPKRGAVCFIWKEYQRLMGEMAEAIGREEWTKN
jgi:hypothetical protein